MARFFLVLVAVYSVLALVEAGGKKAKRCAKNIKKFEACLKKGYKSDLGCESGDGELKDKAVKKCKAAEKKLKKCDYTCVKTEPELPYDLNCKRAETDFWGADIRSFQASSFEDCAMACAKEPGCKSITTRNSDNNCWLKNKNGGQIGPSFNAAVTSMNMKCDRSEVDASCKRENVDYWGADLRNFKSQGFDDCAFRCRDTEECQSFTIRKSDNYCWLKSKRGGQRGPSPNSDVISMNIKCIPFDASDKTCAKDGFDFWGADLRNFQSSGYEDCRTNCYDAADCVSFTLRKSDNHCWMKTKEGGAGTRSNSGLISANMSC